MAHAGAGSAGNLHGPKFWAQIERLLQQKAPITIGWPEAPHTGQDLANVVPKCFPLARRMMNRVQAKYRRRTERTFREAEVKPIVITDAEIVAEFGNWELAELRWHVARRLKAEEYGLLDISDRPRDARARRILEEGRTAHRKSRRLYLDDQYAQKIMRGNVVVVFESEYCPNPKPKKEVAE